jgi:hypothetical protein
VDYSRVTESDNLKWIDDGTRVDSDGILLEPYLTSDGPDSATPKGHMLSDEEPEEPDPDPPPTVTAATPSSGPTAGGTEILITGTGFVATPTVTVGGETCTSPTFLDASQIECTTGTHGAGTVDVIVTNPDAQTGTALSAYTYVSPSPTPTPQRLRFRAAVVEEEEEFTCTQTFSSSTGLATAISNAANGSTICLNNGSYGVVNLFDMARSGYVTVRSTTGRGATIQPQVGNSDFMRFEELTIPGFVLVNSCSTNIQFVDLTWTPDTEGLLFDASSCPSTTHNYLVDNVDFTEVGMATYEGRLNCRDCNGAIFQNSLFVGVGSEASDGIQTQGGTENLTIANNTFSGILESLCGATHCDAIQLQGGGVTLIENNYFLNGDTFIMSPDGCANVTVEDNVFDGSGVAYDFNLQFGSCDDLIFRHNTLYNASIAVDSKVGEPASTNALLENNVYDGDTTIKTDGGNGCTSCTIRYGLWDAGGTGTNNVVGTPDYVGARPSLTWAGWQLDTGSPGENAGNDGQDMGTRYYGSP